MKIVKLEMLCSECGAIDTMILDSSHAENISLDLYEKCKNYEAKLTAIREALMTKEEIAKYCDVLPTLPLRALVRSTFEVYNTRIQNILDK